MQAPKRSRSGIILLSALVIAFVMMLWVVAALTRSRQQAQGVRFSHRKSQAYYLAKTGASRALYVINRNPGWITAHASRANADDSIVGDTLSWIEDAGGKKLLKCEAKVGPQVYTLNVPIDELDQSDTQIYSVSPAVNGGMDQIAQTSVNSDNWKSLPPLPGGRTVVSVAGANNGDLYAVAVADTSGQTLWRYRAGRGWMRMPDTPANVSIDSLAVSGNSKLVARGADNSLLSLNLQTSLEWEQHSAPTGTQLQVVTMPVNNAGHVYATGDTGGGPTVWDFDTTTGQWSQIPNPVAAHFNPSNGRVSGFSGDVPNFDGGIGADDRGNVYVASNPPGEPSVIYQRAAASGTWELLPAVPAYSWAADSSIGAESLAYNLKDLKVDDTGVLWVQWQSDSSNDYGTIRIDPTGAK